MATKDESTEYRLYINDMPFADIKDPIKTDYQFTSRQWDKLLKKSKIWSMTYQGGQKVTKAEMEYYLHRKGKYYLRGKIGKIVFEGDDPTNIMKNFKYGDKLNVEFETE